MFLLRYLHRSDIFPSGDLSVRAAVTALDRLDKRITPKAAERRSERWRPYRLMRRRTCEDIWELHHLADG